MPTLFPIQGRQDSRYFAIEQEDVAIVGSMEGGYDVTRPRTTRAPRKTISTGFTHITEAERVTLESFYNTVGKYGDITYTHPVTLASMVVRIVDWPLDKYTGIGGFHIYDKAVIKLKEV